MNDRETIPGLLAGSNGASRGEERWNCHYCLSTVSTPGSAAVTRVQHVHLHGQHCPDICSDTLLRRTVTIVGLKYLFNARNKRIQRCSSSPYLRGLRPLSYGGVTGLEPDRTRTCNPQIRNLVPYPLGYREPHTGRLCTTAASQAGRGGRRCTP